MAKTKKKEVQKQGLRPSQKAKAEKLRKKQEIKAKVKEEKAIQNASATTLSTADTTSKDTKAIKAQDSVSKTTRSASKSSETAQNTTKTSKSSTSTSKPIISAPLKTIHVKNVEGEPDTVAEILIQNKIDYTPKVSVVMPVYNVEPYLRQTLDSVLNQALKEIELICVDDGSTDASLDILKEYAEKDKRITVITQKNLRAGIARNTGLSQAKGEYLHFCDSDDWVENDIYTECIEKQADIILFDAFKVDEHLDKKMSWKKDFLDRDRIKEDINSFEFEKCIGSPWGKLFKREFIAKYDIHFQNLRCCNDIYFVKLALALAPRIEIVDKPLYNWRFNSQGNTSSTRGLYSECVVIFAKQLYKSLDKYSLLDKYEDLLYKLCTDAFAYEYSQCVFEKRKNQITLYKEFLPDSYFRSLMEKITPEISVIMPVYNAEENLKKSLDSLLQQTFKNFEIIAINDGSKDNSLEILNFYKRKDHRVQVIDKENEGPGVARNVGISVARGKYITFLDSDDFCENKMLEEYFNILKDTDADIVVSKFHKYSMHEKRVTSQGGHYAKKNLYYANELGDDLFTISLPMPWNKIFRKTLLVDNNIQFPNLKASEDVCFCCNAFACAKKIAFTEKTFVYWTYDNETSLHFTSGNKNFECSFLCFVELKKRLENLGKYDKNEKSFMKVFAHSCKWIITNSRLDIDTTIKTTKKYMQLFDIKKYHYWEKFINDVISLYNRKEDVIISLTSYPARIKTVNRVIETLLNQTMKADKVILWLAPEQFPNKENDLPQELLDLRDRGLTIDWYCDIRSYKKLIPALEKYPEAIIVTADDDILYPNDWLNKLWISYVNNPKFINCHRAHYITFDRFKIKPYNSWKFCISNNNPSFLNFCTTGGGALYPPHTFSAEAFNAKEFLRICPFADDIWFWAMCVLNHKKICVVKDNIRTINVVEGSQDDALWHDNVLNKQNDAQIKKIIRQYPQIVEILKKEQAKNYLSAYLRLPFMLFQIYKLRHKLKNYRMKFIKDNLASYRIDIKNFGNEKTDVEVQTTDACINDITWNLTLGKGKIIEGNALSHKIKLKAINNGILCFDFRGIDRKFGDKRIPLWTDYKSIKINGQEILSAPIATWHDKPYRYEMLVKDGQEVTLEIEQQYHEYNEEELKDIVLKLNNNLEYIVEHIDDILKELKKTIPMIDMETYQKIKREESLKKILSNLTSYRIDVKNYGSATNNLEVLSGNLLVSKPEWFITNQGIGRVFQNNSMHDVTKLKMVNNGILCFDFRGIDRKFGDKRIPLWTDYKSIKIDGKEILSMPVATWHDKPYRYEMPVKDGQEVILEIEQQYHQYTADELQDIIVKLYPNDEFIKENISVIIERIQQNTRGGGYSTMSLESYPQITADCFVPLGSACRPARWLREYKFRYCSLPFDWMMRFSLSTVLSTLKQGVSSWFNQYEEDQNRKNTKSRYVTDTKNHIISMHAFPIDKTVDEYMPEFKETFARRYERMKNILKTSENVCFVCNRNDTSYDFILFLKELVKMYPQLKIQLLNIRHSDSEQKIMQYIVDDNIVIYDISANDIHKNGADKSNPSFWIGNEDLWSEICSNLALSEKARNSLEKINKDTAA